MRKMTREEAQDIYDSALLRSPKEDPKEQLKDCAESGLELAKEAIEEREALEDMLRASIENRANSLRTIKKAVKQVKKSLPEGSSAYPYLRDIYELTKRLERYDDYIRSKTLDEKHPSRPIYKREITSYPRWALMSNVKEDGEEWHKI